MKYTDNYSFETNERFVTDKNGNDLLKPLMESSSAFLNGYIKYDSENDRYLMSTELMNWYTEYADNLKADLEEIDKLSDIYGEAKVQMILDEEFDDSSYMKHHTSRQKAFDRIKKELKPIK